MRSDLKTTDLGRAGWLISDPAAGTRFRFGDEERQLLEWLDEGLDDTAICRRYRERFGYDLTTLRLRDFVHQLRRLGLWETNDGPPRPRPAEAETPADDGADVPEPLSDRDPGAVLNHRFDVLVVLFGWLLHPVCLVPLLALCWVAAAALTKDFARYLAELTGLAQRAPLPMFAAIALERWLFLSLPRELMVGMACRRFGGRVRALRSSFFKRLLPMFECDVGDNVAFLAGRAKWTLLSIRLACQIVIGSAAVAGWTLAEPGSLTGTFFLLLILPCVIGALLHVNVFMKLDAYAMLMTTLRAPRAWERATREAASWLTLRRDPEPLTDRQRFWLRAYGLAIFAWQMTAYVVVVGVIAWLLISSHQGTGALITLVLLAWWHQDWIKGAIMERKEVRWLVRGGGVWWLRWLIRLCALAAMVACAFIPYAREVSGTCRVVPIAEEGVRAEIPGTIAQVHVAEDDWVDKGAVIVTLAARDERAEVKTTKAELDRAKADLALRRAGSRPEEIALAAQEVELRQIQLDHAETELRRLQHISGTDAASEIEVIRARDTRDGTEKVLRMAEENYRRIEDGSRKEEIEAAEAEVARLEALLAHAEELLALHEIKAPISGRIVTPNVRQRRGQYVLPGDLIAVVQDTSELLAAVTVQEAEALRVVPGQALKVRLRGTDDRLIGAQVERVSQYVVDQTELSVDPVRSDRESLLEESRRGEEDRYLLVLARFDDSETGLIPGMTGYARITVSEDRLGAAILRPIARFVRVEIWSWLP